MSKAITENNRNGSVKIVVATFENEIGSEEVSGEKIQRQYGFFDSQKSEWSGMEKNNYPENTILHLNQAIQVNQVNEVNTNQFNT